VREISGGCEGARKLTEASIYKYTLLSRQMESFAERGGYCFLSELIVDVLRFRASWKDGALASSKKLERLRTFMRFALQRKWISDNPASALKAPSVQTRPTLPFTHNDIVSILAAIEAYAPKPHTNGKANAQRMRSPVLLLR
jgi:site-specific recombinase XerD